jgi:signal transduction histidine kinase
VVLDGLTVDGDTVRRQSYPPGRGDVSIHYAALGYGAPHKIQFRYRLEGQDADWVEAGTRRTAYYGNLPPGRYRFAVRASNRDGVFGAQEAQLSFTLQPPFHRTRAFQALVVTAAAAVLVFAYVMRMRVLRSRLLAVLQERTRIARELHDTLAQGLAGLGMQLDTALKILPSGRDHDAVRFELEQGRSVVRMSLAEVRRSIWVLRTQARRDGADLATSLSRGLAALVAGSGASWRFEVRGEPRRLPLDLEHGILRIAHEAVTNAARHAQATTITAALCFENEQLILAVQDDGRGFDAAAAGSVDGTRFGLLGLSERARALGGDLRLTSRPGAGTEVECRLPYRITGPAHDSRGGA